MDPEFREDAPQPRQGEEPPDDEPRKSKPPRRNLLATWTNFLVSLGLGESMLRVGTTVLSLMLVGAVIWMQQSFNQEALFDLRIRPALAAGPTPTAFVDPNLLPPPVQAGIPGVIRKAKPQTDIPSRPRQEIVKYTVQTGDTVFGIAEKFGLSPETILWGNYNILADDPHLLSQGQELNILPVNGILHEWMGGTSFDQWANFFGVTPADIIEYPGNHINLDTVGDYTNPNIPTGTSLIIPGGKRDLQTWFAPLDATRDSPTFASVMGQGACGIINGGAVGYGTFVWPANKHYLSGYDFHPPIHWGIDIAGNLGEPVFAADAGVIVYAGWNQYGFGNMIMIDHGTGFQTLYGHLSDIAVGCGQSVGQGQEIGAFGSTGRSSGPHLHFEIRTTTYFVNPWDYLPPP
jgi:murein DD-endopeptidase MepM/ murein hydrolase activator NlpD